MLGWHSACPLNNTSAYQVTEICVSATLTSMKPFTQIAVKPLKHFKSQEHGHLLEGSLGIRDVRCCRQRAIMKMSSTEVKKYGQSHKESEQELKVHAYHYLIENICE